MSRIDLSCSFHILKTHANIRIPIVRTALPMCISGNLKQNKQ